MTANGTSHRLWRYGSLFLFVGLPVLFLGFMVFELIVGSEARSDMARQQATLSQIVANVARLHIRGMTAADTAALYLASASGSLARAEIEDLAAKLVAQAGGTLVEAQIVGTPEQEAAGTVAIQVTLTIGNEGLRDLLYETEAGLPLLAVSDLSVTRDDGANDGPIRLEERAQRDDLLHVDMTVQGHWRKTTG